MRKTLTLFWLDLWSGYERNRIFVIQNERHTDVSAVRLEDGYPCPHVHNNSLLYAVVGVQLYLLTTGQIQFATLDVWLSDQDLVRRPVDGFDEFLLSHYWCA